MSIKMLVYDFRPAEEAFFKNNNMENFDIKFFRESLTPETVKNLTQEEKDSVSVISVFIDSVVNEDVISQFKNLRIISTRSAGTDHICTESCGEKNIALVNVVNYGAKSVAQYITGLMIALVRNIIPASEHVKYSTFKNCADYIGRELSTLTIGIVGTGAIGAAVCKIASAFNMKIIAYDIYPKKELERLYNLKYVEMDELLKTSDIISLHIPFTGNNAEMFSQKEFEQMKQGAYFINAARGELVNIEALLNALKSGKLAGVALDVVMCEVSTFRCDNNVDISKLDEVCAKELVSVKELVQMENVIITPHAAYETQEAIDYILKVTFDGIMDCIKGGTKYRV